MSFTMASGQPRIWRRGRFWALVVIGLVTGLVVQTWATGGFERARNPYRGEERQLGETFDTRFWDVVIHDAVQRDGSSPVKVAVSITNKQDEAQTSLTEYMLVLRFHDGRPAVVRARCAPDFGSSWQPGVTRRGTCDFYADTSQDMSLPEPPYEAELVVLDQEMSDSFLEAAHPISGWTPAGWVRLPVAAEVQ